MKPSSENSAVGKATVVLYLAFVAVWCAGAVIGEIWPGAGQPSFLGMPLWFVVSCLASFLGVSAVLVVLVRGWLR